MYDRLRKNAKPWSKEHTESVKRIKQRVKNLPCLHLPNPDWFKIVETDASDIEFGGILKQLNPNKKLEELVRFHSGKWNPTQYNYSTIKKELLTIIKCIHKFQDDLLNKKILVKSRL